MIRFLGVYGFDDLVPAGLKFDVRFLVCIVTESELGYVVGRTPGSRSGRLLIEGSSDGHRVRAQAVLRPDSDALRGACAGFASLSLGRIGVWIHCSSSVASESWVVGFTIFVVV